MIEYVEKNGVLVPVEVEPEPDFDGEYWRCGDHFKSKSKEEYIKHLNSAMVCFDEDKL